MLLEEILLRNSAQKQLKEFARNRLDGQCIYCGEHYDTLTADHIVPRSKGGQTTHWNLVSCCITCNREKGSKDWFEWWKRSGHYENALIEGRVDKLKAILSDCKSQAEFFMKTLAENPNFRMRFEKNLK